MPFLHISSVLKRVGDKYHFKMHKCHLLSEFNVVQSHLQLQILRLHFFPLLQMPENLINVNVWGRSA